MTKFIVLALGLVSLPLFAGLKPAREWNTAKLGAIPDMVQRNTDIINQAITQCSQAGGGVVTIPPGEYFVKGIYLKSNVTLNLPKGTILRATQVLEDHIEPKEALFSGRWARCLIFAENAENIRITGGGIIDGCHVEDKKGEDGIRGPHTIIFSKCKNVSIDNVEVRRSGNYTLLMMELENAKFESLTITEGWDGIHLKYCKNVLIDRCRIFTGDDSIAGCYLQNVLISNCTLNTSCNAVRIIGPAEDFIMKNCYLYGDSVYSHRSNGRKYDTYSALNFQPGAWGAMPGKLKNIQLQDLKIHHVRNMFVLYPNKQNQVENITLRNIKATEVGSHAVQLINWEPTSSMKNIHMENIHVEYRSNVPEKDLMQETVERPWIESANLPVWGFYASNLNGMTLKNCSFSRKGKDFRRGMLAENVQNLSVENVLVDGKKISAAKISEKPISTPFRIDFIGNNVGRLLPVKSENVYPMIAPGWAGMAPVLTTANVSCDTSFKTYKLAFKPERTGNVTVKLLGHWNNAPENRTWVQYSAVEIKGKNILSPEFHSQIIRKGKAKFSKDGTICVNHDNTAEFNLPVQGGKVYTIKITAKNIPAL